MAQLALLRSGSTSVATPIEPAPISKSDLRSDPATASLNEQSTAAPAREWGLLLLTLVLIRAAVFLTGVLSVATVHSIDQVVPENASGTSWIAFDCHFYRYISTNGYPPGPEIPYQIAYFPFLPMAAWTLHPLCNALVGAAAAPRLALLIVANGCALVGFLFFYAWARQTLGKRIAFVSVLLLAVYPGSMFFCAGETEGPFMMFVAMALCLLQRQRFYAAAAISAIATSARPTAVCLALTVVVWTIYYSRHLPWSALVSRILLIGVISGLGGLGYESFLWSRYGRYDAFMRAEDKWDLDRDPLHTASNQRILQGVDQRWTFADGTSQSSADQQPKAEPRRYSLQFFEDRLLKSSAWNRVIALAILIAAIAFVIAPNGVPRLLMVLPLAIFLMSYLPNWGLRTTSIFRYETPALPLFAALAIYLSAPRRRPLLIGIVAVCFAVQLYYAFLFNRGFWVG
jgi:hypothetical protein